MSFKKDDLVNIGEPPNTEVYRIVEEPQGEYAKVVKADGSDPQIHTVYMGRWFTQAGE